MVPFGLLPTNLKCNLKKKGFCFTNVDDVILNNLVIGGQEGKALMCKHVRHLVGTLTQEKQSEKV